MAEEREGACEAVGGEVESLETWGGEEGVEWGEGGEAAGGEVEVLEGGEVKGGRGRGEDEVRVAAEGVTGEV